MVVGKPYSYLADLFKTTKGQFNEKPTVLAIGMLPYTLVRTCI